MHTSLKLNSLFIVLSLSAFSIHTEAAVNPSSYGYDERISYLQYNPDDVFIINTNLNVSTLIQLEEGEYINGQATGVGMGDASAWSLAIKGNNIFLKPKMDLSDTNMIVVTNQRTYALQLRMANGTPSYIVRFVYPDQADEADEAQAAKQATSIEQSTPSDTLLMSVGQDENGDDVLISKLVNTDYSKRGDEAVMPMRVWDDGLFTFLKYPNSKDIPVVYKVMPDGSETLVNNHIEDDTTILHGTAKLYRLRLGSLVGDILNNSASYDGHFNESGTSDKSLSREVQ